MYCKKMTSIITLCLIVTSAGFASSADEYKAAGRSYLFNGTLSGIRQAYQIFDEGVNDPACPDCATDRELLFFHAVTRIAMWTIRDDGTPIDSGMELAKAYGDTVFIGDTIHNIHVESGYTFPENRYGQPLLPDNTEQVVTDILRFMETAGMDELQSVIDELETITETPDDRFRIFINQQELSNVSRDGYWEYGYDVEIDYGEVLMLKAILNIIKGAMTARTAYDTHLDPQPGDYLLEKFYENNMNLQNDLLLPNPDFLKLLPTANDPNSGADVMAQSRIDILNGLRYYQEMVDYLWNEDVPAGTDPQNDELLSLDPNDRYISDVLQEKMNAFADSLESDTPMTIDGKTTKSYNLQNTSNGYLSLRAEVMPLGDWQNAEIDIILYSGENPVQISYREVDVEIAGNQIKGYANDYGNYGYFEATLNEDHSVITNASFDYWGYNEGSMTGLSGSVSWEYLEEQWTADFNPVFGNTARYRDPVSPRELLCEFDAWNKPLPGTLPDPTMGGVAPGLTQMDWIGFTNPQPSRKIPFWPEIYPWQKSGETVDLWLNEQLIFEDTVDELGEGWYPGGTDIDSLYMGCINYGMDFKLCGCLVLNDLPEDNYYYQYEILLSYSPLDDTLPDSLKIEISGQNGTLQGQLLHQIDEGYYCYWRNIGMVNIQQDGNLITFDINMFDVPTYISGRYVSVNAGWGYRNWSIEWMDENETHIQVGMTGTISGTVNFPGYRGGPIFVQAYADRDNPEESLVAYTLLTEPGEFTLEHIGLGFDGYIRAFSPLFGEYHPVDMGALKARDVQSVFLNFENLEGVDLTLEVPTELPPNTPLGAMIDAAEDTEDYYAFDAIAGRWNTFELECDNGAVGIVLLDRNGADILRASEPWAPALRKFTWWASVAGRYYIKVCDSSWTPTGGSYVIRRTVDWLSPAGDISGPQWQGVKDGRADLLDFVLLSNYWLEGCAAPYWCEGSDYNKDGEVDLTDLTTLLDEWTDTGHGI